jgi:hypothetical protein
VSADATAAYYSGAPVPISPDRAGTYLVVEFREGESTQVHVRHLD